MARINLEPFPAEPAENISRRPIKARRARRRRRRKSRCCFFFLIIIFLAATVSAVALAKTGIVRLPVISDLLYQLPIPTRQINIPNQANFKAEGFSASAGSGENEVVISLTEIELTYVLRQLLASGSNAIFAPNVQAVIADSQVELYGRLQKPLTVNLTVTIQPFLTNGRLDYKITGFKAGDLNLPPVLANSLINVIFGNKISQFVSAIAQNYRLNRLDLADGRAVIGLTAASAGAAIDLTNLQINFFKK